MPTAEVVSRHVACLAFAFVAAALSLTPARAGCEFAVVKRVIDDVLDRDAEKAAKFRHEVTTGSDSGYIYKTYGFGTIEELELLREAGFHPLEVIRAATLSGAEAIGAADRIGSIEAGKLADLVVVAENPLADLKVLLGTGAIRVSDDNQPVRVGGVRYTIKDGIVYDAKALLADVRRMVAEAKQREGIERLPDVDWQK